MHEDKYKLKICCPPISQTKPFLRTLTYTLGKVAPPSGTFNELLPITHINLLHNCMLFIVKPLYLSTLKCTQDSYAHVHTQTYIAYI